MMRCSGIPAAFIAVSSESCVRRPKESTEAMSTAIGMVKTTMKGRESRKSSPTTARSRSLSTMYRISFKS